MVSESEFWRRIQPLKTAYRRIVAALLAFLDGNRALARERLGAAQTAIAWARDRGVLDEATARYLMGLVGSRIQGLESGHLMSGALEYAADRILAVICRLYVRKVGQNGSG